MSVEKDLIESRTRGRCRDNSISTMLADVLKDIVESDDRYEAANSAIQLLKRAAFTREDHLEEEDLYER